MPAITITDLTNAKTDVDHLSDLVSSASPTATDRLGNTKRTWAGLLADVDTSVADAILTITGGEAAATAAEAAAEVAQAAANLRDTLAQGEGATTTGQYFAVKQVFGKGAYLYKRTATGSQFLEVAAVGARAQQIATERVIKNTLAPPVAGLTTHLWGQGAWEWDNRLVPNEVATVLPTLNWLPDPFNPLDEDGGTTPARTINTGATTDPLGGSNALQLDFTAANQQFAYNVTTNGAVPATDVRVRLFTKLLSGGSAFKLGTTSGLSITPGAAWDASALETIVTGYTNAAAIGVSTATGNTTASLAVAGAAIFDPLAGESASLPTLATTKAAQNAGHMKASLANPGALPLTSDGAIALDGTTTHTPMIYLDASHTVQTKYSFGGAFKCSAMPTGDYGSALAFDKSFSTPGSDNTHGQIGVYGATDSVAGRPGRLYVNPGLSLSTNTTNRYYPGEGYHTVIVTVDNGDTTIYLDGVPAKLGVIGSWVAPAISRMIAGAYNSTRPRVKTVNPYVGEANGLFYAAAKALTQAEVTAQDKHIRARLRLYGQAIGARKVLQIGDGDSLTSFSPSWWWHLGECSQLAPRLHGHLTAVGGTKLRSTAGTQDSDWSSAAHLAILYAKIDAAAAAGYDEIWISYCPMGANDSVDMWKVAGNSYLGWKTEMIAHFATLKARSSKVRILGGTMLPRLDNTADDLPREQQRMLLNDDLRANYAAWGIDRLVDTGLGTERVSLTSVVTAETIPGGTAMGNFREAQGAFTSTRNPAATLSLSALSGASFTATAPAGTFTSADVYRVIVAGGGEAKITNFSTAGGTDTVTLSTTSYVPPAWPSEPAAITARDTITRAAFGALSYASGAWTVRQDAVTTTRLYQTDGLHPGYPGGRMLAEIVWPHTKAIQDPLLGAAL